MKFHGSLKVFENGVNTAIQEEKTDQEKGKKRVTYLKHMFDIWIMKLIMILKLKMKIR